MVFEGHLQACLTTGGGEGRGEGEGSPFSVEEGKGRVFLPPAREEVGKSLMRGCSVRVQAARNEGEGVFESLTGWLVSLGARGQAGPK